MSEQGERVKCVCLIESGRERKNKNAMPLGKSGKYEWKKINVLIEIWKSLKNREKETESFCTLFYVHWYVPVSSGL